MNDRSTRRSFAARPHDAEDWIKKADRTPQQSQPAEDYAARLTVDVTADMRGRIKIAAFQRGLTVADMLRALFEREFPTSSGDGQ